MQPVELHTHGAYLIARSDECVAINVEEAVQAIHAGERMVWLNVYGLDDQAARRLLEDQLGFHELAVEDALSDAERPTLQEFGDVLFFVVPVPTGKGGFEELAFFFAERSMVTYCRVKIDLVTTWFERWMQRPERVGASPARLAYVLVDAIVDAYFPLADQIEDEVDLIAERLFQGDARQVHQIQRLKRRLLVIRRQLGPTRDVLNALLRRDLRMIPSEIDPYFQDVLDHVLRLSEMIDSNREMLASLLDVHLSTVSNNTNEVMKRMTYFATALMAMALVAGVYGMNFTHMPELQWKFGYPLALLMMVGAFLLVTALFKRKGWL